MQSRHHHRSASGRVLLLMSIGNEPIKSVLRRCTHAPVNSVKGSYYSRETSFNPFTRRKEKLRKRHQLLAPSFHLLLFFVFCIIKTTIFFYYIGTSEKKRCQRSIERVALNVNCGLLIEDEKQTDKEEHIPLVSFKVREPSVGEVRPLQVASPL